MKTCFYVVVTIVVLTAFAWGQNAPAVSDARELEKEMDIMGGILGSVLKSHFMDLNNQFPSDDSSAQNRFSQQGTRITNGISWVDVSSNERFYLKGQGIVFMIPTSSLTARSQDSYLARATLEAEAVARELARSSETLNKLAMESAKKEQEMLQMQRKTLEKQQETLQMRRETLEKQQKTSAVDVEAFRQAINSVREPLADILAKYGDSLSAVKSDEYINLVFYTSSTLNTEVGEAITTISARKSWITDYKAGKMTLDEFRKKVLQ